MKKLFLLLLLFCLPLCALAEGPTLADDVVGEYIWPEGAAESDAAYIYRCRYPQLAGEDAAAEMINNAYLLLVNDALGFECPMNATAVPEGQQMVVDISYKITHSTADFLSVKVTKRITWESGVSTVITGQTFALTGDDAGMAVGLPHLLGILDMDNMDEWYQERQIAKADDCARTLVWEMLQDGDIPLHQDMTEEEFEWCLYPEEDFYLDAAGDVVFFLQEGLVAPMEHGTLLCPIPLKTLLDEI